MSLLIGQTCGPMMWHVNLIIDMQMLSDAHWKQHTGQQYHAQLAFVNNRSTAKT